MQKWLEVQRKVEEEEHEDREEGEETKIAVQEIRKVADGEDEGVGLEEEVNDLRKSVRTAVDAGTRICEESPGQRNAISSALKSPAEIEKKDKKPIEYHIICLLESPWNHL